MPRLKKLSSWEIMVLKPRQTKRGSPAKIGFSDFVDQYPEGTDDVLLYAESENASMEIGVPRSAVDELRKHVTEAIRGWIDPAEIERSRREGETSDHVLNDLPGIVLHRFVATGDWQTEVWSSAAMMFHMAERMLLLNSLRWHQVKGVQIVFETGVEIRVDVRFLTFGRPFSLKPDKRFTAGRSDKLYRRDEYLSDRLRAGSRVISRSLE